MGGLLLGSLGSGGSLATSSLGGLLAADLVGLGDTLDDTDSNGLPHVADGKTAKRGVLGERLHAHGLLGKHLHDGGITFKLLDTIKGCFRTGLDGLGEVLKLLARTTVDLLLDLVELASDVGGVAVEHRRVAVGNLAGVVQDDDLSQEALRTLGGVVLGVTAHVATADILDGDVLDVEADVVTGDGLLQLLVVHLNGLDLSCHHGGSKGDDHAGLQSAGLNTADGHRANTADLVHILKGQAEGLAGGAGRGDDGIQSLQKGLALGVTVLAGDLPALVPGELTD